MSEYENPYTYLALVPPSVIREGWAVAPVAKTVEVNDYFMVDVDEYKVPLGIEMLNTRQPTAKELEELWEKFPAFRNAEYKKMLGWS